MYNMSTKKYDNQKMANEHATPKPSFYTFRHHLPHIQSPHLSCQPLIFITCLILSSSLLLHIFILFLFIISISSSYIIFLLSLLRHNPHHLHPTPLHFPLFILLIFIFLPSSSAPTSSYSSFLLPSSSSSTQLHLYPSL